MPRESEKNAFWFKLNAKNLHLECYSACNVESHVTSITGNIELMHVSAIEHAAYVEKTIVLVRCVILNIKESVYGLKKTLNCLAFEIEGIVKFILYCFSYKLNFYLTIQAEFSLIGL